MGYRKVSYFMQIWYIIKYYLGAWTSKVLKDSPIY